MNSAIFHWLGGFGLMLAASLSCAEAPGLGRLSPPQMEGGKPLMQVLHERKSTREFGTQSVGYARK